MEKRLELLRAELNLSWGELCDQLGIGRSMLAYLRSGARNPSMKLLRRIIEAERAAGIAPLESAQPPPPSSVPSAASVVSGSPAPCGSAGEPATEPAPAAVSKRLDQIDAECKRVRLELAEMNALLHDLLEGGGLEGLRRAAGRGKRRAG